MASNDLSNSISSVTEDNELLCDDVLPYGWYRFLAYGMWVKHCWINSMISKNHSLFLSQKKFENPSLEYL